MNSKYITVPYTRELFDTLSSSFDCGNKYLTQFIKDTKSLDYSFGKTYILLSGDKKRIVGYYSISMSYLEEKTSDVPFRVAGSAHIEMFAVDNKYQGIPIYKDKRASDMLIRDCINRVEYIRQNHIGCSFITLTSTKEGHSLYLRNGFEDLDSELSFSVSYAEKNCIPMCLPLDYE